MDGIASSSKAEQASGGSGSGSGNQGNVGAANDNHPEPMIFATDLDDPTLMRAEMLRELCEAKKQELINQDVELPAKPGVDMTITELRAYMATRRRRDVGEKVEETEAETRIHQQLDRMRQRLTAENKEETKVAVAAAERKAAETKMYGLPIRSAETDVSNVYSVAEEFEIHETARRVEFNSLHFANLELQTGDTMVFIDYPGSPSDIIVDRDCYRYPWVSQSFRVHSDRLLDTGSSKFAEMLNPTYQFRVQRRRKLVNKLPDGVKYVLDLTPPTEGDELVFQVTELSLTPGIRDWWKSSKIHNTASHLVKGHDDVCNCVDKQVVEADPNVSGFAGEIVARDTSPTNSTRLINLPMTGNEIEHLRKERWHNPFVVPEHYNFKDYCAIRHRNAIVRLLLHIHGHYMPLHSAATMWTLVGVAKIFDCPLVVATAVSSWMLAKTNSVFIEVLPEEAIKIAFDIQHAAIATSAYRILVNELALENAHQATPEDDFRRATIFGRTKGDPGDEIRNLIQHGARTMVERATMTANLVTSEDAPDNWDIPEWARLCSLETLLTQERDPLCATALDGARSLKETIKARLDEEIRYVFYKKTIGLARYASVDFDRAKYVEPKNWRFLHAIIPNFNTTQKFLMPYIYDGLEDSIVFDRLFDPSSLSIHALLLNSALTELKRKALRVDSATLLGEEIRNLLFESNSDLPTTAEEPWFRGLDFYDQLKEYMFPIARTWQRHDIDPPLNLTQHLLLNLTANELRYLPLWAGGCNDETGGVFEDILPPAAMGPIGPGPSYRTGMTVGSDASSVASSFVGEMSALDMRGTDTLASIGVNDSVSTIYRPDEVIVDDESIAPSDSFSVDQDYDAARLAVVETGPPSEDSASQSVDFMEDLSDDSTSTIGENDFDSDLEMFE